MFEDWIFKFWFVFWGICVFLGDDFFLGLGCFEGIGKICLFVYLDFIRFV